MKNKKGMILLFFCIIMVVALFFVFFKFGMAKNQKIGKNSSSQEIVDYILNMDSYEAKVEIQVKNHKNSNNYVLKQQYLKPNISTQEVVEPGNIAGVKIIKNGNQLKLENSSLSLSSVFENYQYLSDNVLDLSCFIQDYMADDQANWTEENNQIVLKTQHQENKDRKKEELYIDKITAMPVKMEIKDTNQNTTIYILYNEVTVNSLKKENVLAFETTSSRKEI